MRQKVAVVVFLYNYNEANIDNIQTYAGDVDEVFAFDNTEITNKYVELKAALKKIPNLLYIDGKGNQGLAIAINKVARICIKRGYDWLITFDQDSQASENMILNMKTFAENLENKNDIGIISPLIKNNEFVFAKPLYEFSYVEWVIQSGAMHNLDILRAVDGYNNDIYIDALDTEYCYRLMDNHYKIVRLNTAVLLHNVNEKQVKIKEIHGKKYYINKFSPYRYYYIVRNNLYCLAKYGKKNKLFGVEAKNTLKTIFKTWILEEKKGIRAKAICLGVMDFMLGRMGKIKWTL